MDDTSSELAHLREELRNTEQAFRQEYYLSFAQWNLGVGPLRISAPATSAQLANIYILFNATCFVVGVVFVVLRGLWTELGVALIVGSLFAFGAFVAQLWVMLRQRGIDLQDRLLGDTKYAKLERISQTRKELLDRIENLQDLASAHEAAENHESKPSD